MPERVVDVLLGTETVTSRSAVAFPEFVATCPQMTRVFDALRSRATCVDAGQHSARSVSTHSPWVVGLSPTHPTGISAVQRLGA
jgi:hypothetical protein